MNVRLNKTLSWYNGVVYKNKFFINHSSVELYLLTVTKDNREQNIAYERLKYWVRNVLDDSVLIAHDDPLLPIWQKTNSRVIVLPDEPVDQIMGIMLYLKANAIMENRMVVIRTDTWSALGDSMTYIHSHGDELGSLATDGWWSDARPTWQGSKDRPQEKVVTLDRPPEWTDHGLGWEDDSHRDNVVFAEFNKNDDQ